MKDAPKALAADVAAQYGELSVDEIKTLVVDDKWLAALAAAVQSELNRVSQALTSQPELRLVNVARASLEELLLDYEDYLRQRKQRQWG